jgi:thymidylate kinase
VGDDAALIVVTGLPGAGKSTVAQIISVRLGLPLLDKDDVLERLFDEYQADAAQREQLSRSADEIFLAEVGSLPSVVAVSFWRRHELSATTGTPIDRFPSRRQMIEVWCDCDPAIALDRFFARERHPAHGDAARDRESTARQLRRLADLGPLGVGHLVIVDTSRTVDIEAMISDVGAALADRR